MPPPLSSKLGRELGLRAHERPSLYCEIADAATDTDLPFWTVLMLSGAIATLGLVLNSTAVVIGAMLVAPLLGPLLGLSLSVAVGDGRLFVQTALSILTGAAAIVALAALVTWVLPIDAVTDEIAARTRPNTLDLLIAIFSGLAGAVVMASRETRLSGSIPGVAVAVALVPPLGVAGFGIGTGFQWPIITGSLLLFGANLAGIVLSGLGVFLSVGMHRPEVVARAKAWHREDRSTGLARVCEDIPLPRTLDVASSPWKRMALTTLFVAAVSLPLTRSFSHIVREVKVSAAADTATASLEKGGETLVLERRIDQSGEEATVTLRIATQSRVSEAERLRLAQTMTRAAGEPVRLSLSQIVVPSGRLAEAAQKLPDAPSLRATSPAAAPTADLLAPLRQRLADGLSDVLLPAGRELVGASLRVAADGAPALTVAYGGTQPLSPDAAALVAGQAARAVEIDPADAATVFLPLGPRSFPSPDEAAALRATLRRWPHLGITLIGGGERVDAVAAQLSGPAGQLSRSAGDPGLRLCVREPDGPPGCTPPPTPATAVATPLPAASASPTVPGQ